MKLLFVLLVSFWTSSVAEIVLDRIIIWNVGQGLWITILSLESCTHIDMGGEKADWKKLVRICGSKNTNRAVFSHWDLDHISFAERAARELRGFCIATPPRGPSTPQKLATFAKFRPCKSSAEQHSRGETSSKEMAGISELKFSPLGKKIKSNDMSRIFLGFSTLFPGDSTAKQERVWSRFILPLRLKYLVLGHHGSKTSTSNRLLERLPNLRLAISSARKKRYGHPHRSVIALLTHHGVSTVSTEQWNNIVIEIR